MSTSPRYLGKYELQERLGRGGMGEVWKAFDPQLARYVAIKILHPDLQHDPDFLKRFEREARVLAALRHPNIVRIHDFQIVRHSEAQDIIAYMVMGYIKGQTLADYMRNTSRNGKFLPVADILHLFTSVGLAIDYAHQYGIIHRDIKPANILLDQVIPSRSQMGTPILSDFGIVKLLGASGMTTSGAWAGTPLYTSPEQAQGYPGDIRSDLYSLGVILYELCTGALPFQGTPAMVLMQHITTMPMSPTLINPAISSILESIIMRSLAKDPAARFPSASALAIALAEAFMLPIPEVLTRSAPNAIEPPTLAAPSASVTPVYSRQGAPATPTYSFSSMATQSSQDSLATVLTPPTYMPPSSFVFEEVSRQARGASKRLARGPLTILISLLLLVLVSSGTWMYFTTSRNEHSNSISTSIVGHAFFHSSGQVNPVSSRGVCDQLVLDLNNIVPPVPGKSYYVWLLSDSNQPSLKSLLLGTIVVSHSSAHFVYPGDFQHSNLIASMSRLLVTEEDADTTATGPSSDYHTWRYYAELPQELNPIGNHRRVIDHLRELLYESHVNEIPGGADNHVFGITQEIVTLANNARGAWFSSNSHFLRDQIIRMLDYLDGVSFVQKDVPPGTALLVDPLFIKVGLLSYEAVGAPSSLRVMDSTMLGLITTPGLTPERRMLAIQTDKMIINNVSIWLQHVHDDAKALIVLSDQQLLQPSAQVLLSDMVRYAGYSLDGWLDSTTGQRQEGVVWIHNTIQLLATFDITMEPPKTL